MLVFSVILFLVQFGYIKGEYSCPYRDKFGKLKTRLCDTGCCGTIHNTFCCHNKYLAEIIFGSIVGFLLLVVVVVVIIHCCYRRKYLHKTEFLRATRNYGTINATTENVESDNNTIDTAEDHLPDNKDVVPEMGNENKPAGRIYDDVQPYQPDYPAGRVTPYDPDIRPDNQPYYPDNQPYYPENQPYYPDNQPYPDNRPFDPDLKPFDPNVGPYNPDNQPYNPDIQPYNPDTPYIPDDQPYRPDNQPYIPDNEPYRPDIQPYYPDVQPYPDPNPAGMVDDDLSPYDPDIEPYSDDQPYSGSSDTQPY